MNKKEIISFFDRMAPDWDSRLVVNDEKINFILNKAGVTENCTVLDVACGTGVLFPYYLHRNVSRVIGVDISPSMTRIAASKNRDIRVEVICADIEAIPVHRRCDCCVVYNAFPHFPDPQALIACLASWVIPGGRLTVAHSMSLAALKKHHQGPAKQVSRELPEAQELSELFAPWFTVDCAVSDDEKYVVSGVRKS